MIVSEKGCVAALKKAFEKGYEIVPMSMGKISIYTENWALETTTRELPLAVSQILVEHYGGIPVEPMMVRKGRAKQTMFGAVQDRLEDLLVKQKEPAYMNRIPVTFHEKWDVFVKDTGEWMCVDRQYLDILEGSRQVAAMMTDEGMALFALADEKLTIAPGRFGADDTRKLQKIAEMYKKQELHEVVPPENLSLFDDMNEEE